jgi:putative ABC transport system permease protein
MKENSGPPQAFVKFFRWFCHPQLENYIEGDLTELYHERRKESGKRIADLKFIIDVLLLFRPGIIRPAEAIHPLNDFSMFKNYFKVGVRNILKYKVFSFINVFGLALAMSVCMLVLLMLADQFRYDRFHEKKERVYRILSETEGGRQPYATSPFPLAKALKSEYPVVEETTSLHPGIGGDVTYGEGIVETGGYFAEPSFFSVFSFKLEKGNEKTALVNPHSIIITEALADRLFGNEDPIGKTVDFTDRQLPFPLRHDARGGAPVPWGNFTITGVIDETKYTSHLKFDVLMSAATLQTLYAEKKAEDLSNNWEWYYRTYTYALLQPGENAESLNTALRQLVAEKYANIKAEQTKGFKLSGQNLSDIQLGLMGNDTNDRLPLPGYYFLGFLAIVIMISACLNYTNLSVARSLTRAKEIGVRKVTGATRKALVFQFLSESVITALLSLVMAVLLLMFIKPAFKGLWINKHLNFELPDSPGIYLIFTAFALVIGFVSGLYPAMHLSKYQPVKALKDLNNIRPGRFGIRKVLGVSQFVISLFFITTSILMFQQFKHFMEFDYGFTSKNIVNIPLQGADHQKVINEFSSVPGVGTISASDIIPATGRNNNREIRKAGSDGEYIRTGILITDENFTANLGVTLVAGKNLPAAGNGPSRLVLVNEDAVKAMGYKFPAEIVGEVFENKWGDDLIEVCGVVENFRYRLLINEHEIGPLMLQNQPEHFQYLNVRITSPDLMGTISRLEERWKKIDPIHPLKYEFFDEQLAGTHQGIFDVVSILGFIAFLAITIACLGLLGMATYTAERRKKEVGIRKVLGAANVTIALLLSKEFLKMLLISVCIAGPLSYLINNFWLQMFPNRVDFGFGTVFLATIILLVLGLITIGSQTIQASKRNPVDALKME